MANLFIERRRSPRNGITELIRVHPVNSDFPVEFCTTFNISGTGLYLKTSAAHYFLGMTVELTRNFVADDPKSEEIMGAVVRVDRLEDGNFGVAVAFTSAV